jgi:hypothetical protein
MGFTPSPYNMVQSMGWADKVIWGNLRDRSLPFHWDFIKMNLPGVTSYDPSHLWMPKQRNDGDMAAKMMSYCDDLQTCGPSREAALFATCCMAKMCNYLGIQDALQKRLFPAQLL